MARTQKYTEELLLEAVVKYAEKHDGKIKATELAAWADSNIPGLEGVRDYHFMRPVREKHPKTGVITARSKSCTDRMNEITKARSLTAKISSNALLKASTIDAFMDQPGFVQRRQIAETRETVDKLAAENAGLSRANEALRAENKKLRRELDEFTADIQSLQHTQRRLLKQVSYLMKVTDEKTRKEVLQEMGIADGSVDLDVYANSLEQKLAGVLDFRKTLIKYLTNEINPAQSQDTPVEGNALLEEVLSGINFGGEGDAKN